MNSPKDPCTQEGLMHPDEAIAKLLAQVNAIEATEVVSLDQASGRVLAEDLASCIDLPSFDNSAMDGYAFTFNDLQNFSTLTLIGQSFAGSPYDGECPAGSCIRIMTGAPVPAGYDTVQMQENVTREGDKASIETPGRKGASVRLQGSEVTADTKVLFSGTQLGAAELGVLATIGVSQVKVTRPLKVAFFSSGSELKPVGTELAAGQIYDSNRYTLQGLLNRANVQWQDLGVVVDDPEAIRSTLRQAARDNDLIITSGGVSVGEADFIKQVINEEGEITFWRLAVKPGKPFAFGRVGDALFCGLPGNPVSVMVTFYLLVWPIIKKMQGIKPTKALSTMATLTTAIRKRPGRVEYQRGILSANTKGELEVAITGAQGSGMLTSMCLANCFVVLAQQQGDVDLGAQVTVEPFNSVLT